MHLPTPDFQAGAFVLAEGATTHESAARAGLCWFAVLTASTAICLHVIYAQADLWHLFTRWWWCVAAWTRCTSGWLKKKPFWLGSAIPGVCAAPGPQSSISPASRIRGSPAHIGFALKTLPVLLTEQLFRHQFQHQEIRKEGKSKRNQREGRHQRGEIKRDWKTETIRYSLIISNCKISVCMHHWFNYCIQLYPSAELELQKNHF